MSWRVKRNSDRAGCGSDAANGGEQADILHRGERAQPDQENISTSIVAN